MTDLPTPPREEAEDLPPAAQERPSLLRRIVLGVAIVGGCLVLYLLMLAWMIYTGPLELPAHHGLNRGENGAWLGHRWFDDRKFEPLTPAGIEAACERFKACGIRYLYIHVGPTDRDGHLPGWDTGRWTKTRDLLRKLVPGCRLLAWVGGVNADFVGSAPDTLSLKDIAIRSNIVKEVARLRQEGFDGVHYDFEPLADHDGAFLALLSETTDALQSPRPGLLSVAAPWARPRSVPPLPFRQAALWSPAYYRMVAQRCDQLVLMAYDGGQPSANLYSRFVRYEVRHVDNAVECPLLIGVPTYKEKTLSHDPSVESLEAALRGVILAGLDTRGVCGVAVYAEWTTTPQEWDTLRRMWCEKRE